MKVGSSPAAGGSRPASLARRRPRRRPRTRNRPPNCARHLPSQPPHFRGLARAATAPLPAVVEALKSIPPCSPSSLLPPQFGKRLLAEAGRSPWAHAFPDYRGLKAAIKADVAARGGPRWARAAWASGLAGLRMGSERRGLHGGPPRRPPPPKPTPLQTCRPAGAPVRGRAARGAAQGGRLLRGQGGGAGGRDGRAVPRLARRGARRGRGLPALSLARARAAPPLAASSAPPLHPVSPLLPAPPFSPASRRWPRCRRSSRSCASTWPSATSPWSRPPRSATGATCAAWGRCLIVPL